MLLLTRMRGRSGLLNPRRFHAAHMLIVVGITRLPGIDQQLRNKC
jgi:hypothetical protein